MTTQAKLVVIQLCQSNSIGSRYNAPRVIEWQEVTREEADALLARNPLSNGCYCREEPEDTTGN